MYTSHCVFLYTNTHDYISVRCVCKHIPVARSYSLGQPLRGVKRRGRNRRQVAAPIEATSVAVVPVTSHMLRNVYRATVVGARQRLTVSARVAVHRTIKRGAVYVARNAKSKEAH